MKETYKALHLKYLKMRYGEKAEQWKDITTDDRLIYCNIYHMMIEALESLPDEPNNYVCVALNKKMERDCSTLESIKTVFGDR